MARGRRSDRGPGRQRRGPGDRLASELLSELGPIPVDAQDPEHHLSYRRFMVLVMVGELGAPTQRALADGLAVTEPSVTRMVAALADSGLLSVMPDPAGGNRRRIALTDAGRDLVNRAGTDLIERLTELVEASGVPFETYLAHTRRLNAALNGAGTRPAYQDSHHL